MIMTRAIALGFVVFNAEAGFLIRVQMAVESGFNVFVFDNSPQHDLVRNFCANKEKVKYLTCGKNLGLGLGISFVCAQAFYENNSALVFFDQDSVFNEDTLNFIEEFYLSRPELELTHSAVVFSAKDYATQRNQDCFKNVSLAINSGSLFYLGNLKKIGWHNSKYFVDCVDYEFCLRSKINGFKIGEYSCTPGFDHSIEQVDKGYRIFSKIYLMRAYPLFRMLDTTKSSIRLISYSLFTGNVKFAVNIARLFLVYAATQVVVRFFILVDKLTEAQ